MPNTPIIERAAEKLAANKAAALTGALALALGIVAGSVLTGSETPSERDAKLEQLGEDLARGSAATKTPAAALDAREYHDAIRKVRDGDPQLADLLSSDAQPGASVVTGANFPLGARLPHPITIDAPSGKLASAPDVEIVGPSAAAWRLDAVRWRDDADAGSTWIEIEATNTGTEPARLIALVRWEVP